MVHVRTEHEILEKGKDYSTLPELNVYYISETDIWKKKQTCYRVKKTISEEGEAYRDGINITYINAEVDDQSEVAQLMKYFKIADPQPSMLSSKTTALACTEIGFPKSASIT